jgi:hypothetical protein
MPIPFDDIYQQIGQSIVDQIGEDWLTAEVIFEIQPDVRSFEAYYISEATGKRQGFRLSQTTKSLLKDLHAQMAETSKGNWTRAIFRLQQDGEFTLSFDYE